MSKYILHIGTKLWGLPDASPFVTKAHTLLRMAQIDYDTNICDLQKAPKGKMPYLTLPDGTDLADSHFIRLYLEKDLGKDFSGEYSKSQLAIGWAFERMAEDHLYWIEVYYRWTIDENFNNGPRMFFNAIPENFRENAIKESREYVARNLLGQGISRHKSEEIEELGKNDIDAIKEFLGEKPFILGDNICAYDASVQAMLWTMTASFIKSPVKDYIMSDEKLMAYIGRIKDKYYPDL